MTARPPSSAETMATSIHLSALRMYRDQLSVELDRVAYWKRVLRQRVTALGGEHRSRRLVNMTSQALNRALGHTGSGQRRLVFLEVSSPIALPPLPTWEEEWVAALDATPTNPTPAVAHLTATISQLTRYSHAVRRRHIEATDALVLAYRRSPETALDLLPAPSDPSFVPVPEFSLQELIPFHPITPVAVAATHLPATDLLQGHAA